MIIYTNLCSHASSANGLEKRIRQRMPGMAEYLYDMKALEQRLKDGLYDVDVMVVHVGGNSPISELLAYQGDLKGLNIILVLSGITSDEQIARLLKLYPRYMTFDANDDTVLLMLENRVKNSRGKGAGTA
ncbi:MAG: hypothetical protein SWC96_07610 [Thermodesulfobacteriota bacterium]|nr:hypothetical protein [Thermodesulfobacteriota bacterium]